MESDLIHACSLFFFVLLCQIVMDVMCIVKKTTIIVIFYSTTTYKKHPLKTFDYIPVFAVLHKLQLV